MNEQTKKPMRAGLPKPDGHLQNQLPEKPGIRKRTFRMAPGTAATGQMNHDPFGQIGGDRYLEPPDTGDFRYTKESLFDFPHEELYTIHLPVRTEENIAVDFTGYCECDKCRKDKENAVALYRGMTVVELDGRVIYIDHLEGYLLERMSVVGR